jgi:hypothetical protein
LRLVFDTKQFDREMKNLIDYSMGYLDGVKNGKKALLNNLGKGTIEALGQYIDVAAKMRPDALHHVYEWYQTGGPGSRLFDLDYTVSGVGLSIKSTFRQSSTLSRDANKPFYDKARIMEYGVPVTIKPKSGGALRFMDGGQEVFTRSPVVVQNPGGTEAAGSYEKVFNEFFRMYFTQAFLKSSGIFEYIKKPQLYKNNLPAGIKNGRSVGVSTGYKWITSAKIGLK